MLLLSLASTTPGTRANTAPGLVLASTTPGTGQYDSCYEPALLLDWPGDSALFAESENSPNDRIGSLPADSANS